MTEAERATADQRITFHPVEVVPLSEDRTPALGRKATQSRPSSAIGFLPAKNAAEPEVQYPVMTAEEFQQDATAEYEEELAPIVSAAGTADESENFAPIISAADFVRPGRATDGEQSTPPDLSLSPMQSPPAAAPVEPQTQTQPRGLFSGLRFPEFRSRPSRAAKE